MPAAVAVIPSKAATTRPEPPGLEKVDMDPQVEEPLPDHNAARQVVAEKEDLERGTEGEREGLSERNAPLRSEHEP